ncbi:MAG: type II secretion system protein [Eubacterium sp.]|nr:type II secretion system protein [Eubacterium sp.]
MKSSNRGFSLVELIIVIAIMAILSAAIAPTLIRYINKARKADDIAAADAIGTTLQAAITEDDELYDFVNAYAADTKNDRPYKILAYCNPINNKKEFHIPTAYRPGGVNDDDAKLFKQLFIEYIGASVTPMKFTSKRFFDQWVICTDKDCKFSVWVGAGIGDSHSWLHADGTVEGAGNRKFYMLWPEVEPAYNKLSTPPKTWNDGSTR